MESNPIDPRPNDSGEPRFPDRTDWLLLLLMSAATIVGACFAFELYGASVARLGIGGRWFQSDTWRVVSDMTEFSANHYRGSVHPFFAPLTIPLTKLTRLITGMGPLRSIWTLNTATLLAWANLLYLTQRLIGCPRLSAMLVCVLGLVSASSLFWFTVPESYPLGSLSILACMTISAACTRRKLAWPYFVAANCLTLGITVTNVMTGIAVTVFHHSIRRSVVIVVMSVVAIAGIWITQKFLFAHPPGMFLKARSFERESSFFFHPDAGGFRAIVPAELNHPIVMPPVTTIHPHLPGGMFSVQKVAWGAGDAVFKVASAAWWILLAVGAGGLLRGPADRKFRTVLGSVLLGQIALHLIYGEETFLYSLHFAPLLLLTVSLASLTPTRRLTDALLAVTIVAAGFNNLAQLNRVAHWPESPSSAAHASVGATNNPPSADK